MHSKVSNISHAEVDIVASHMEGNNTSNTSRLLHRTLTEMLFALNVALMVSEIQMQMQRVASCHHSAVAAKVVWQVRYLMSLELASLYAPAVVALLIKHLAVDLTTGDELLQLPLTAVAVKAVVQSMQQQDHHAAFVELQACRQGNHLDF